MMEFLSLLVDAEKCCDAMRELAEHLADLPPEVVHRVVSRFDSIPQPFCLDADARAASKAGDYRIVLKPSADLLELIAALRAGEIGCVETQS